MMARIHEGRGVHDEIVGLAGIGPRARGARSRGSRRVTGARPRRPARERRSDPARLVVRGATFPSPRDLGLGPEEYLSGLGDLVGEMRRLTLSALSTGKLEDAEERLREMESVFRPCSDSRVPGRSSR